MKRFILTNKKNRSTTNVDQEGLDNIKKQGWLPRFHVQEIVLTKHPAPTYQPKELDPVKDEVQAESMAKKGKKGTTNV